MENFIYSIPTKVYFGRGKLQSLGEELTQCGSRGLLVYGGGSIRENGCYQEIVGQCEKHRIALWELSGVTVNPDVQMVEMGAELCREHGIEFILAAGGGSVLDCGKMIAAAAKSEGTAWELVQYPERIEAVLPIVVVSTIAASGSEMDYTAVISNKSMRQKVACGCKLLLPRVAFLDPTYSMTVGMKATAEGIADIMSHLIEIYFSESRAFLQERLNEGAFRTCLDCGKTLLNAPDDYEARANLMWTACWAMNGFLRWGKPGNWTCHVFAHELGAMYPELSHGQILSVLLPRWLRIVVERGKTGQIVDWAKNVWDIREEKPLQSVEAAVAMLERYFQDLGLPGHLDIELTKQDMRELTRRIVPQVQNAYVALTVGDIERILKESIGKQSVRE